MNPKDKDREIRARVDQAFFDEFNRVVPEGDRSEVIRDAVRRELDRRSHPQLEQPLPRFDVHDSEWLKLTPEQQQWLSLAQASGGDALTPEQQTLLRAALFSAWGMRDCTGNVHDRAARARAAVKNLSNE